MSKNKIIKTGKAKIEGLTLDWRQSANDGYASLDMFAVVDPIGTVEIRRNRPNEEPPGAFVTYHNGNRISDNAYATHVEALSAVERYVYSNPIFKDDANALLVNTALTQGRQAYREGLSIYQNPFGFEAPANRSHWVEGWLQAFGGKVGANLTNALVATERARAQLKYDNNYLLAAARMQKCAINYGHKLRAELLENVGKSFGKAVAAASLDFAHDLITEEKPEVITAKYPDWETYRDNAIADMVAEANARVAAAMEAEKAAATVASTGNSDPLLN